MTCKWKSFQQFCCQVFPFNYASFLRLFSHLHFHHFTPLVSLSQSAVSPSRTSVQQVLRHHFPLTDWLMMIIRRLLIITTPIGTNCAEILQSPLEKTSQDILNKKRRRWNSSAPINGIINTKKVEVPLKSVTKSHIEIKRSTELHTFQKWEFVRRSVFFFFFVVYQRNRSLVVPSSSV